LKKNIQKKRKKGEEDAPKGGGVQKSRTPRTSVRNNDRIRHGVFRRGKKHGTYELRGRWGGEQSERRRRSSSHIEWGMGIRKECIEVNNPVHVPEKLRDIHFSLLARARAPGVLGTAQPAAPARITPHPLAVAGFGSPVNVPISVSATDANGLVATVLMDRDQVAAEVVFAGKGAATARVLAYV